MSDYRHSFTGHGLDRGSNERTDENWLAERRAADSTRFLVFCGPRPLVGPDLGNGACEPLLLSARKLKWLPGADLDQAVYLGADEQGAALFALNVAEDAAETLDGMPDDLRALGVKARVAPVELSRLGLAKSLLEWHAFHAFCSTCGAETHIAEGGGKRVCPACSREHFPRVDPVAIVLVHMPDKCLMARQKQFPPGMYSANAGFIEPGESIEEAARREVHEEVGIALGRVRYHSSQPWPFPSTLMIGCLGEALDEEIRVDPAEIETARWFSREEAAAMMAGNHPDMFAPMPFAIAHHLLKAWLEETG